MNSSIIPCDQKTSKANKLIHFSYPIISKKTDMKSLNRLFIFVLIFTFTLLVFIITSDTDLYASSSLKGWVDNVSQSKIIGWTCDRDKPEQRLHVHIYATGTNGYSDNHNEPTCFTLPNEKNICFVAGGIANSLREEAVGDECGNNTFHGYEIDTPGYLVDGQEHEVYVYAFDPDGGPSKLLNGSPKEYRSKEATVTKLFSQNDHKIGTLDEEDIHIQPCTNTVAGEWVLRITRYITNAANSGIDPCNKLKEQHGWAMENFTGVVSPNPKTSYQRGIADWYGGNSYQVVPGNNEIIGIMHNPYSAVCFNGDNDCSLLGTKPYTGTKLYTMAPSYDFPSPYQVQPWANNNTHNRIRIGFWLKTEFAQISYIDDRAYVDLVLKFRNSSVAGENNKFVWVGVRAYDHGYMNIDKSGFDHVTRDPEQLPIMGSAFSSHSYRVTTSKDSETAKYEPHEWMYMAFEIHGDQFIAGIKSINKVFADNPDTLLPTDPSAWYLDHFNITNEILITNKNSQGTSIGIAFKELKVEQLTY